MRKEKKQSQKKKQKGWSQRDFISGLKFLTRNSQNKCLQERYRII